jgi:hypothetical protein
MEGNRRIEYSGIKHMNTGKEEDRIQRNQMKECSGIGGPNAAE